MNSEDVTLPLPNQTRDTNPLLIELLADFRTEREANEAFRKRVLEKLDAIEREQRLMRLELKEINSEQSRQKAHIAALEEDFASPLAA